VLSVVNSIPDPYLFSSLGRQPLLKLSSNHNSELWLIAARMRTY